MSKEKIILSVVATFIGLLVAGSGFYLYQRTKVVSPEEIKTAERTTPTPTPTSSFFLSAETPRDEEVVEKKVVSVSGKTAQGAVVTIVTPIDEKIITPDRNGNFTTTVTIDNGQNIITITAVSATGEEKTIKRTVTFSTEEF